MDAINWGKFAVYHYDAGDLETEPDLQFPFVEGSRFRAANIGVDEPAVQINLEDFHKGVDIPWTLAHDEVHTVIQGECQIKYHLPPLMLESGEVTVKAGDAYYMPRGCRVVWRVLSDEPFRHYCVCFPNPGYPIPVVRSARKDGDVDRATLLLTYTPRPGTDLDEYHRWLREVDNPFFNGRPVVRRYVNYRIERSMAGEAGFTHFDTLEVEAGDETAVFGDPKIAAFAAAWVERWGAKPATPGDPANYHVHICRAVAAPEAA